MSSGYGLMWKLGVPAPPSNAPPLVMWANDSFAPSPQVHPPLVCQTTLLEPPVSTEPSPTAAAAVGWEAIVPGRAAARRPPAA